jgi:hypothetical protein
LVFFRAFVKTDEVPKLEPLDKQIPSNAPARSNASAVSRALQKEDDPLIVILPAIDVYFLQYTWTTPIAVQMWYFYEMISSAIHHR